MIDTDNAFINGLVSTLLTLSGEPFSVTLFFYVSLLIELFNSILSKTCFRYIDTHKITPLRLHCSLYLSLQRRLNCFKIFMFIFDAIVNEIAINCDFYSIPLRKLALVTTIPGLFALSRSNFTMFPFCSIIFLNSALRRPSRLNIWIFTLDTLVSPVTPFLLYVYLTLLVIFRHSNKWNSSYCRNEGNMTRFITEEPLIRISSASTGLTMLVPALIGARYPYTGVDGSVEGRNRGRRGA